MFMQSSFDFDVPPGRASDENGPVSSVVRSTLGRLLLATPPLGDENFDRSVVYMLDHQAAGAFGLVVNRPSLAALPEVLEDWQAQLASPAGLFDGGPVETDGLIALAESTAQAVESEWTAIHGRLAVIDLSRSPADMVGEIGRVRIFRGYAGWGPLQLDAEMEAGAWMVFPASPDDVFSATPTSLWREVLRRQGGRTAWIANAPDDVASN